MSVLTLAVILHMTTLILDKKNVLMTFHHQTRLLLITPVYLSMIILTVFMKRQVLALILMCPGKQFYTKRKLKLRTKPWINGEIQRLMTYRAI